MAGIQHDIQAGIEAAFAGMDLPDPEVCAATKARVKQVEAILQKHDVFINGNGKDGMKTVVPLMQQDIKVIKDFMKEIKGSVKWTNRVLWGVILVAVLNLILKV
jgi:hypothetical protein